MENNEQVYVAYMLFFVRYARVKFSLPHIKTCPFSSKTSTFP